jgi:hypothetical protein
MQYDRIVKRINCQQRERKKEKKKINGSRPKALGGFFLYAFHARAYTVCGSWATTGMTKERWKTRNNWPRRSVRMIWRRGPDCGSGFPVSPDSVSWRWRHIVPSLKTRVSLGREHGAHAQKRSRSDGVHSKPVQPNNRTAVTRWNAPYAGYTLARDSPGQDERNAEFFKHSYPWNIQIAVAQSGLVFGEGCEFGKNKHFLQVFCGDLEIRFS